jgi:hypothetical protein
MGLRKPRNIKKSETITSIKQIKTKRRTKTIRKSTFPSSEKPVLITYQAIPVSVLNK